MDYFIDPGEGLGQALTGVDVHAGGSGHRHNPVSPFSEDVDDVASQPPGCCDHGELIGAGRPP
ncbi:hypothetical protein AB0H88_43495 [Nonomuraea sp. NPDC050680]|uniref:hypothetical protein n=1 Tax=Nonomuraea sp. NPDC050680 TaxID=3154630 RepID=UPI0033C59258